MKCASEIMRLYAVTDRRWLGTHTLAEQVEQALKGGVTCVQLREKELGEESFLKEAMELKTVCERYHVPLIINDNIRVTVRSNADGVHIGQNDISVREARRILGEGKIIGVTAKTVEQALDAQSHGADYLGSGAVFDTSVKSDAVRIDHEVFKAICRAVEIPVVAIGGITEDNILQLSGYGMDGAAIVSGIFSSRNIEQTCKRLRKSCEQIVLGG